MRTSDRIRVESLLTPAERRDLDTLCRERPGRDSLPAAGALLRERFGVNLVHDPAIVAGFISDSSNLPGSADALCRPRTARECAAAFRAFFRTGTPYTVSAGRSNLTGSATPEGGVIVSLRGLSEPAIEVDEAARRVTAPAGLIFEEMRESVRRKTGGRLHFPVDPTSRGDACVGGALACNASGFTPGEIGAIRGWVESVDMVLPDGGAVRATRGQYVSKDGSFTLDGPDGLVRLPVPRYRRPAIKNAGGPYSAPDGAMDFVDLVVGSEGLLGVITSCSLRLAEAPGDYLDLFFSLPSEDCAVTLLDHLREQRPGGLGSLTAIEYFGANCRNHMKHAERLFRGERPVAVYVQVPLGTPQDADEVASVWLERLSASDCGVEEGAVLVLDNEKDRAMFMEARHSMPANAVEVVQRRGTYTVLTDTVVPPDRFREFLAWSHGAIKAAGIDYMAFGHLGDCHLHFALLPERGQMDRAVAVYDGMVARSAELGGVYSGEHGTGKRKRKDFMQCYGVAGYDDIRRCKEAVDPQFLLNRGNVIEWPPPRMDRSRFPVSVSSFPAPPHPPRSLLPPTFRH